MNKNISLLLNALLAVAVGILYYLHFTAENPEATAAIPTAGGALKPSAIAYVDTDSLLESFALYKDSKTQLEAKKQKLENNLSGRARVLEDEVGAYQQKAAGMSPEQRQQTEEGLMRKQQELMQQKDEMMADLAEEQIQLNNQLYDEIAAVLKAYADKTHYDFILGYTKGGGILYAKDSLDITKYVIGSMNKAEK